MQFNSKPPPRTPPREGKTRDNASAPTDRTPSPPPVQKGVDITPLPSFQATTQESSSSSSSFIGRGGLPRAQVLTPGGEGETKSGPAHTRKRKLEETSPTPSSSSSSSSGSHGLSEPGPVLPTTHRQFSSARAEGKTVADDPPAQPLTDAQEEARAIVLAHLPDKAELSLEGVLSAWPRIADEALCQELPRPVYEALGQRIGELLGGQESDARVRESARADLAATGISLVLHSGEREASAFRDECRKLGLLLKGLAQALCRPAARMGFFEDFARLPQAARALDRQGARAKTLWFAALVAADCVRTPAHLEHLLSYWDGLPKGSDFVEASVEELLEGTLNDPTAADQVLVRRLVKAAADASGTTWAKRELLSLDFFEMPEDFKRLLVQDACKAATGPARSWAAHVLVSITDRSNDVQAAIQSGTYSEDSPAQFDEVMTCLAGYVSDPANSDFAWQIPLALTALHGAICRMTPREDGIPEAQEIVAGFERQLNTMIGTLSAGLSRGRLLQLALRHAIDVTPAASDPQTPETKAQAVARLLDVFFPSPAEETHQQASSRQARCEAARADIEFAVHVARLQWEGRWLSIVTSLPEEVRQDALEGAGFFGPSTAEERTLFLHLVRNDRALSPLERMAVLERLHASTARLPRGEFIVLREAFVQSVIDVSGPRAPAGRVIEGESVKAERAGLEAGAVERLNALYECEGRGPAPFPVAPACQTPRHWTPNATRTASPAGSVCSTKRLPTYQRPPAAPGFSMQRRSWRRSAAHCRHGCEPHKRSSRPARQ